MKAANTWRYKNTALLFLSLVVLFFLSDTEIAHALIKEIGNYDYLGAAAVGVFFVSTFTVAPASVVLFHLSQDFNPYMIAACAGAGAVVGDLLIFRFMKDGVFKELRHLFYRYGGSYVSRLLRTPYFAWLTPVIGAIIIASPLPDELGIALMGLSKIKTWQFVCISFALNTLGIFLVVLFARSV